MIIKGLERMIKGKLEQYKLNNDYKLFLDVIISCEEATTSFRPCSFRYIVTEKPTENNLVDLSFDNQ